MILKKWLIPSTIVIIIIAISCVLIMLNKNRQPVYTESQKKFIEMANKKLESLSYNFVDKKFEYEEKVFDDENVDRTQFPEHLKSGKRFCRISYLPKEEFTFGGHVQVFIDMDTEEIVHVERF